MATRSRIIEPASSRGTGVGSPISNEAYDVISALHAKLEGLEAYRKYSKDANAALWQKLTRADLECVELLVIELERLVHEGAFRMLVPGRTDVRASDVPPASAPII